MIATAAFAAAVVLFLLIAAVPPIAPLLDRPTSAVKIVSVVGVTFAPGYPNNLLLLAKIDAEARRVDAPEWLTVILRRNPANPHDANAVEVHVPALGEMAMIGPLARDVAARIAPLIDDGVRFHAEIHGTRINPDHLDRPGIDIAITRVASDD